MITSIVLLILLGGCTGEPKVEPADIGTTLLGTEAPEMPNSTIVSTKNPTAVIDNATPEFEHTEEVDDYGSIVCRKTKFNRCLTFRDDKESFTGLTYYPTDQPRPEVMLDSLDFVLGITDNYSGQYSITYLRYRPDKFLKNPDSDVIKQIAFYMRVESWNTNMVIEDTKLEPTQIPSVYVEFSCQKVGNYFYLNPLRPYYHSRGTTTYLVLRGPSVSSEDYEELKSNYYFMKFRLDSRTKEIDLLISNNFNCIIANDVSDKKCSESFFLEYWWDGITTCSDNNSSCGSFNCLFDNYSFAIGVFAPGKKQITMKLYAIEMDVTETTQ